MRLPFAAAAVVLLIASCSDNAQPDDERITVSDVNGDWIFALDGECPGTRVTVAAEVAVEEDGANLSGTWQLPDYPDGLPSGEVDLVTGHATLRSLGVGPLGGPGFQLEGTIQSNGEFSGTGVDPIPGGNHDPALTTEGCALEAVGGRVGP